MAWAFHILKLFAWLRRIVKQLTYFFKLPFCTPTSKTWHTDSLVLSLKMGAKDFKKLLTRLSPPGATDKESGSVHWEFLFFPISMSDQVNQSLRVNKCGKDKTNIFFQLDWFIPCVSSHEEEAQCFYQISCCHEMICLFTNDCHTSCHYLPKWEFLVLLRGLFWIGTWQGSLT